MVRILSPDTRSDRSDLIPTPREAQQVRALPQSPDILAAQQISRRGFMKQLGMAALFATGAVSCVKMAGEETESQNSEFGVQRFALTLDEASKVLEIEILLEGGSDGARFGLGYIGVTTDDHTAGPIKMPPANTPVAPPGYLYVSDASGAQVPLLKKRGDKIIVIRTDMGTSNHEPGKRAALTGDRDVMMPSTPVLRAKAFRPNDALAYLHDNGMVRDGGVQVGSTAVGNVANFAKLAYPNLANPNSKDLKDTIFPIQTSQALTQDRFAQMNGALDGLSLPDLEQVASARLQAQGANDDIITFLDTIKGAGNGKNNGLLAAASIALTLFKQGHLAGVSLQRGGFDTHQQATGQQQMQNFQDVFQSADQMLTLAAQQGIPLRIVFKSDFGRHATQGDISNHHSIGQVIFMGEGVKGPKLVGVLDPNQNLVDQKTKIADVLNFQGDLNGGLREVDVGVPLELTDITTRHAVQDILDKQP